MHLRTTVSLALLMAIVPATLSARQDHHASMKDRGGKVMGFDQDRTTHHFLLHPDGGAIDVRVNDKNDAKNRDAIRSHLPHLAMLFADGNFQAPMLVHDSTAVPGTKEMAARKSTIRYRYVETPAGGRVDLVSTDTEAVKAIHAFLRFQIADHKTGDPLTVRPR